MPNMEGHILILSGPPGAGKSTAAARLARAPSRPAVHLHADDFWGFVGTGRISPERPEAQVLNSVVMEAVAGAAAGFARGGFMVIVDCVIGPWFLSPFRQTGLPVHYVVLRVGPELAIARCQARGGDTLTDPGSVAALNRQFRDMGDLERHAIEVDDLSTDATVIAVEVALTSGAFRLPSGLSAANAPGAS